MPKPSLLPRLIHSLNNEEQPIYVKWVEMKLVNRPGIEQEWFNWMYDQLATADFPEEVTKGDIEDWWSMFSQSLSLNQRAYERINDRITAATEEFIAYRESETIQHQSDINLVYGLSKRNARKLFVRYYRKFLRKFSEPSFRKPGHQFLEAYRQLLSIGLEWEILSDGNRDRGFINIEKKEIYRSYEELIQFTHSRLLLLKSAYQHPFESRDNLFLQELIDHRYPDLPQLNIIRTICLWARLEEPPEKEAIQTEVSYLISQCELLPKDQAFDFLASFLNTLSAWERRFFRQDILTNRLEIYDKLMQLYYRKMPPIVFLNLMKGRVLQLSCENPLVSLEDPANREDYYGEVLPGLTERLEEYQNQISWTYRDQARRITDIHLEFELGHIQEALKQIARLNQRPSTQIYFDLSIKWTQAKCYFLLNDGESLIDTLSRIENRLLVLLKRDAKDSYHQSLKNACLILRKLYRARFRSGRIPGVLTDTKNMVFLEDRFWLSAAAHHLNQR